MIVREFYKTRKDGVQLFRTFSDNGFKINKIGTNEVYDDAIDVDAATFFYIETNEKIEVENDG